MQLNDARSEDFDRVISCSVFDNLIRESGSRRVISVSELLGELYYFHTIAL